MDDPKTVDGLVKGYGEKGDYTVKRMPDGDDVFYEVYHAGQLVARYQVMLPSRLENNVAAANAEKGCGIRRVT